ncbi:MAG TPA: RluA family pseudouridine synthase [Planctomycetes bacterium]|nr:RluA family pseudouridine synthase [Planctomycetota bacterium]
MYGQDLSSPRGTAPRYSSNSRYVRDEDSVGGKNPVFGPRAGFRLIAGRVLGRIYNQEGRREADREIRAFPGRSPNERGMCMNESSPGTAPEGQPTRLAVPQASAGRRLDVWLNDVLGWNSRARVQEQIKLGGILVDGEAVKPSLRLRGGESIEVHAEGPTADDHLLPEDLPLKVIYEDASVIVLDKPPFMAVHPGAGRRTGTLANALAHHFRSLSDVNGSLRPGIVHRLDRDTTGVICVACTNRAHFSIAGQFHDREVEKTYFAIAEGVLEFDEYLVEEPIGRHPANPLKMACLPSGRPSSTRFEVVERLDGFTFVRCRPKTGRTHQIRVHLAHIGHPILCDRLYGRRHRITRGEILHLSPEDPDYEKTLLDRQALHAANLTLFHPLKGERMTFEAPLAKDMEAVLEVLRGRRPRSRSTHQGDRSP